MIAIYHDEKGEPLKDTGLRVTNRFFLPASFIKWRNDSLDGFNARRTIPNFPRPAIKSEEKTTLWRYRNKHSDESGFIVIIVSR